MLNDPLQLAIFLLFGLAVFLGAEALYLSISNRSTYVRKVNRRLKIFEEAGSQHEVMLMLRRARGLSSEGRYVLPLIWYNRLVVQSGFGIGVGRLVAIQGLLAAAGFAAVYVMESNLVAAGGAAVATGIVLPLLAMEWRRRKRRYAFEAQLPDAVDVMVRSLRAGHPLPVAISMVGREMPDPIGSEFGLTADEMTYGLDLETAMGNMSARVGQDDLSLLVVAISIQSQTGGNLSEILSNLSAVLRSRFKMRRRIRAVSAEGRFSAMALSVLPFLVFGAMTILAPNFYGDIWNEPIVYKVLSFTAGVVMVGNLIMYRMVNFRI